MRLLYFLLVGLPAIKAVLQYKGVDWSSVRVVESAGIKYKNAAGSAQPFETILAASGVNTVRQRIWVNPSDGNYNLDYNLALAKRAKAAGLGIYLNLHYSDTWADPSHQTMPNGWPADVTELVGQVYNYTRDVADAFQRAGIQPSIISIGNENTAGLLWPTGKTPDYAKIAQILHSAAQGVKDSSLSTKPQIMIHLDNGWDWETQQHFYNQVLDQGTLAASDFDMMGVSYYPFYSSAATLASLTTSLTNMANTWGKQLVVAETDWPSSCPHPAYAFPSDVKDIPFSPSGQIQWVHQVASVVAGVKGGVGLFYWEPGWIGNADLGSSCESNLMVQNDGRAMESLAVFKTI